MGYESYEKGVKVVAKTLSTAFKFRVPIIATLSVATATTVGLVSTKGIVGDVTINSVEIYYGETISLEGDSFLSDEVEMEYKSVNDDDSKWTTEAPTFVGDYEVRLRSANNFNSYYYSDIVQYTIKPIDVSLNIADSQRITYGDNPTLNTVKLVGKDKFAALDFTYEDITLADTKAKVNLDAVVIQNENGVDVTDCYNFSTEYKEISFLKRNLIFNFPGAEKVYDGTPLENDAFTYDGDLAYEDKFADSVFVSPQITDVGYISNEREIKILNADGNDVTSQYNLITNFNSLTVDPIEITISSNDITKTYDGTPFDSSLFEYEYDGKLLPGDEIVLTFDDVTKPEASSRQVDACENVENSFTYEIVNKDRVPVTDLYYSVTEEFGVLNIDKRPLNINYTNVKVYDRLTLAETYPINDPNKPIFEIGGGTSLANSEEIIDVQYKKDSNGVSYGDRIDAEFEEHGILVFDIYSDSSLTYSVKRNYDISFDSDLFAINKQVLTVALKNQTKFYDGNTDYDQTEGSGYTIDGLIPGDSYSLNYTDIDSASSGEHLISLDKDNPINLVDPDRGNLDIRNDYDIKLVNNGEATLKIKAPKIDINFATAENCSGETNYFSFKYDGTVHSLSSLFDQGKYDFVTDDRSASTAETGWVDLDTPTNKTLKLDDVLAEGDYVYITPTSDLTTDNANKNPYSITPGVRIMHHEEGVDDVDVTSNYNVKSYTYNFEIKFRNVELKFDESEYVFVYDGDVRDPYTSFVNNKYDASLIDLNDGDYITIEGYDLAVDVKDSGVHKFNIVIRDSNGNIVTSNYIVKGNEINYVITPRELNIVLNEDEFEFVYDAKEHTVNDIYLAGKYDKTKTIDFADVENEEVTFNSATYVNAGEYENVLTSITVYDKNRDVDVTNNYILPDINYNFVISKRSVDIELDDSNFTVTYDALAHTLQDMYENTFDKSTINFASSEHKVTFVETGEPMINAGTYSAISYKIVVTDAEDNVITDNYEFVDHTYTLVINKRQIDICLYDEDSSDPEKFAYVFDDVERTLQDFYENGSYKSGAVIDLVNDIQNQIEHTLTYDEGLIYGWTNGDKNIPFSIVIRDKNGKDVTANYDITEYTYTQNVAKQSLDITVNSSVFEFTYDSQYHSLETAREAGQYTADGLISGNTFEFENYTTFKNATLDESGNVISVNSPFTIAVYGKNENDVTDNYDIVPHTYEYKISPIEISGFYTNDHAAVNDSKITFVYDQTARTVADYRYRKGSTTSNNLSAMLVGGDTVANNPAQVVNKNDNSGNIRYVADTGSVLKINSFKIYDGSEDVTSCYKFSLEEYEFVVLKHDLKFNVNYSFFENWKYSNHQTSAQEIFSNGTIAIDSSTLLATGDSLVVSGYEKLYYGEQATDFEMFIKNNNIDVTANYNIVNQNNDPFEMPEFTDNLVDLVVTINNSSTYYEFAYDGVYHSSELLYEKGNITTDLNVDNTSGYFVCEEYRDFGTYDEEFEFRIVATNLNNKDVTSNFNIIYKVDGENQDEITWNIKKREIKISIPSLDAMTKDGNGVIKIGYNGTSYGYGYTTGASKYSLSSNLYQQENGNDNYDFILLDGTSFTIASIVQRNLNIANPIVVKDVSDGVVTLTIDIDGYQVIARRKGVADANITTNYDITVSTYKVEITPVEIDVQFKTTGTYASAFTYKFSGESYNFDSLLKNSKVDYLTNRDFESTYKNLSLSAVTYKLDGTGYIKYNEGWEFVSDSGTYKPIFVVKDGTKDVSSNFIFAEHTYEVTISKQYLDVNFAYYLNANNNKIYNTFTFDYDNVERGLNYLLDTGNYAISLDGSSYIKPTEVTLPLNIQIHVKNETDPYLDAGTYKITPEIQLISGDKDYTENFEIPASTEYKYVINKLNIYIHSNRWSTSNYTYGAQKQWADSENKVETNYCYGSSFDVKNELVLDSDSSWDLSKRNFTCKITVGTNFDGTFIKYYREEAYEYWVGEIVFKQGDVTLDNKNFNVNSLIYSINIQRARLFANTPDENIVYGNDVVTNVKDYFQIYEGGKYAIYTWYYDSIDWSEIDNDRTTDGTSALDGQNIWFDNFVITDVDGNDVTYNYYIENEETLKSLKFVYQPNTIYFDFVEAISNGKMWFNDSSDEYDYVAFTYDGEYRGYMNYSMNTAKSNFSSNDKWAWKEGYEEALSAYRIAYHQNDGDSSIYIDFDFIKQYLYFYNSTTLVEQEYDVQGTNYCIYAFQDSYCFSYSDIRPDQAYYYTYNATKPYSLIDEKCFDNLKKYLTGKKETLTKIVATGSQDGELEIGNYQNNGLYSCKISKFVITKYDEYLKKNVDISDCYYWWYYANKDTTTTFCDVVSFNFTIKYSYFSISCSQNAFTYDGKAKNAADYFKITVTKDYQNRTGTYSVNNLTEFYKAFPELADVNFADFCTGSYTKATSSTDNAYFRFNYSQCLNDSRNAALKNCSIDYTDSLVTIGKRSIQFDLNQDELGEIDVIKDVNNNDVYTVLYSGKGYGYAEDGNFVTVGSTLADGDKVTFYTSAGECVAFRDVKDGTDPIYYTGVISYVIKNTAGEDVTSSYNLLANIPNYYFEIKRLEVVETYKKLDDLIEKGHLREVEGEIWVMFDNTSYCLNDYSIAYKDVYGVTQYLDPIKNANGDVVKSAFDRLIELFDEKHVKVVHNTVSSDSLKVLIDADKDKPFSFEPGEVNVTYDSMNISSANFGISQNNYTLRILPLVVEVVIPEDYVQFYFDGTEHSLQKGFDEGYFTCKIQMNDGDEPIMISSDKFASKYLPQSTEYEYRILVGEFAYLTLSDLAENGTSENTNFTVQYKSKKSSEWLPINSVNYEFGDKTVTWDIKSYNINVISNDYYDVYVSNDEMSNVDHYVLTDEGISQTNADVIIKVFDGEYHGAEQFVIFTSSEDGSNIFGKEVEIIKTTSSDAYYASFKNGYKISINGIEIYFNLNENNAISYNDTKDSDLYIEYIDFDSIVIYNTNTKATIGNEYLTMFFNIFDHYNLTIKKATISQEDGEFFDSSYFNFVYDGNEHSFYNALYENEGEVYNKIKSFLNDYNISPFDFSVVNNVNASDKTHSVVKKENADIVKNVSDVDLGENGGAYIVSPLFSTSSYYFNSSSGYKFIDGNAFDNFEMPTYFYEYNIQKKPLEILFDLEGFDDYNSETRVAYKEYGINIVDADYYYAVDFAESDSKGNNVWVGKDATACAQYVKKLANGSYDYVAISLDPANCKINSTAYDKNHELVSTTMLLTDNYDLSINYTDENNTNWKSWNVYITPCEITYLMSGSYYSGNTKIRITADSETHATISFTYDGNEYDLNDILRASTINRVLLGEDYIYSIPTDGERIKYVEDNREFIPNVNDYVVYYEEDPENIIDVSDCYSFAEVTYKVDIIPLDITVTANSNYCVYGSDYEDFVTSNLVLYGADEQVLNGDKFEYAVSDEFIEYLNTSATIGNYGINYNGADTCVYDIKITNEDAKNSSATQDGDVSESYNVTIQYANRNQKYVLNIRAIQISLKKTNYDYSGAKLFDKSITLTGKSDSGIVSNKWLQVTGRGNYTVTVTLNPQNANEDYTSVGDHIFTVKSVVVLDGSGNQLASSYYTCSFLNESIVLRINSRALTISSFASSAAGASSSFIVETADGDILTETIDETLVVSGLLTSNTLYINGIEYSTTRKSYGFVDISSLEDGEWYSFVPDINSIQIKDRNGKDVTSNYAITITPCTMQCVFQEYEV